MSSRRGDLEELIRSIPDFPKPGIIYRDITPLLSSPYGLHYAIMDMADPFRFQGITVVVGPESRGFIFGAAIAHELSAGFVPIRKSGKLPHETVNASYELEYGTDSLEIHTDAIRFGDKVLMVDDLLATGGTMRACCDLVESLGGEVIGCSFLIELSFLSARRVQLNKHRVKSVIEYSSGG